MPSHRERGMGGFPVGLIRAHAEGDTKIWVTCLFTGEMMRRGERIQDNVRREEEEDHREERGRY